MAIPRPHSSSGTDLPLTTELRTSPYLEALYQDPLLPVIPQQYLKKLATQSAQEAGLTEEQTQIFTTVFPMLTEAEINLDTAYRVIDCESGFKKTPKDHLNDDGTYDKGLWQINDIHGVTNACRYDLECSTKFAIYLIKNTVKGWRNWTCY